MPSLTLSLLALGGLMGLFALVYCFARKVDNYGAVDVAWSYAFAPLALFYALAGEGWSVRRWTLATVVTLWSMRLGTHLAVRVAGHHPQEDTRYQELRRRWAKGFAWEMFKFFQYQAASIVLLGVVFLLPMGNGAVGFHPLELAGLGLWLVAITGEALADVQLKAFKADPANRGGVCAVGLWRLSRHPNYFFEWLIWVAYFLFACATPWGWIGVIAPASILYLLLRVTGIPLTEEQSLKSRGDAYRRYQATTSAFIPWFPRR